MPIPMDVVIMAGGRCSDDLKRATGCGLRAELPIAGRPMAQLVVEAVRSGLKPARIVVAGFQVPGCTVVPAGESFVDSLRNAMAEVSSERFLLLAADLPFITADALLEFVQRADESAAVSYPIVPLETCRRRFPGLQRTAIRLREGHFTGGNAALACRETMRSVLPTLQRAYAVRKRPLKLARLVGIGTLARVGLGQLLPATLPLCTLEERVGRFLGARVEALIFERAEIAADVDSLTQYYQAVELLRSEAPI